MDKELKAKWVAALRSGEYAQGRAYLKIEDKEGNSKYCCLGVLCDIMEVPSLRNEITGRHSFLHQRSGQYVDVAGLPVQVVEETGIPALGYINRLDQNLAALNDNGTPFSEIADIIERYVPED